MTQAAAASAIAEFCDAQAELTTYLGGDERRADLQARIASVKALAENMQDAPHKEA